MKKIFAGVGIFLVLGVATVALLQHFKPEALGKFSKLMGGNAAPNRVNEKRFRDLDRFLVESRIFGFGDVVGQLFRQIF